MLSLKKLHVFLGNHNKSFVCRRFLNSYRCENALTNHKEKCGEDNICTIRTSNESHLYWKKHFHKNPLYLGFMQISKLIMKKIILSWETKQPTFTNKILYLMVIV